MKAALYKPALYTSETTLDQLLESRAATQADKLAYTFYNLQPGTEISLTYAELEKRVRRIAGAIQERVSPGERVILLLSPGPDFHIAFLACLYAGVIAVPAYPPRAHKNGADSNLIRLRSIIQDCEPALALTDEILENRIQQNFPDDPDFSGMAWLTLDRPGEQNPRFTRVRNNPDDPAFLQYTSGSTGAPKGVIITHANIMHNQKAIACGSHLDENSVFIIWQPVYHDLGLCGALLQPLYSGFTGVSMSPLVFLHSPLRWLELITEYQDRGTGIISGGPNFAYDYCADRIGDEQVEGLKLGDWRVAFNGAEPVRELTMRRFAEKFAPAGFRYESFCPCYGLAEATLGVTSSKLDKAPTVLENIVTGGNACVDTKLAIVDTRTGEELLEGEMGEILVNSPSVAAGYWNKPEESRLTFQATLTGDPLPYLKTGDLGFIKNGELFVTGRIKDLIIIDGRNHYPQDLELTFEESSPALKRGSTAAFSITESGQEKIVVVSELERSARFCDREELRQTLRSAAAGSTR